MYIASIISSSCASNFKYSVNAEKKQIGYVHGVRDVVGLHACWCYEI